MKTVQKSVLIWFSPAEMYALVVDIARYPEFLPWCDQAAVLEETDNGMTAKIGISMAGLSQSFTTRNTHVKDSQVKLSLVDGPFSNLDGEWNFLPVGGDSGNALAERACKVELTLRYDFDNSLLAAMVGPAFEKIANSMVDAFVKRAGTMYAES